MVQFPEHAAIYDLRRRVQDGGRAGHPALILHQEVRGRAILRALLFVPWSVAIVVDAFVWRWIYNDLNGVLNYVLYKLHFIPEYVLWTSDPKIVLWAIIAVVVWQGTPFYMMNFLAGLQSIPDNSTRRRRSTGPAPSRASCT